MCWGFGIGASFHLCNGFHEGAKHAVRVDWIGSDGFSAVFGQDAAPCGGRAHVATSSSVRLRGGGVAACWLRLPAGLRGWRGGFCCGSTHFFVPTRAAQGSEKHGQEVATCYDT